MNRAVSASIAAALLSRQPSRAEAQRPARRVTIGQLLDRQPVGSIITAVAGQPTPDADSLAEVLAGLRPNARVPVSLVSRTTAHQTVDVLTDLSSASSS